MRSGSNITVHVAMVLLLSCTCYATVPPNIVRNGKQATALVQVGANDAICEGSAFCIDRTGLFVTNAHVVPDLQIGGTALLVLNSGETDQIKLTSHLVGLNLVTDLAILQTDKNPTTLSVLTRGSADRLVEAASLVVFGYPFGSELATKPGLFPNISISTGHVSALRKLNGHLDSIQMNAALNPGSSGGSVLNEKGEAVGIVKEGVLGTTINFAIPVSYLHALEAQTSVMLTTPIVDRQHVFEPQELHIRLLAPPTTPGNVAVEMSLWTGPRDRRTIQATTTDGRNFIVRTPLLPPGLVPKDVQMTLYGKTNHLVVQTHDKSITVGSDAVRLRDISRIETDPELKVTLLDNRVLKGAIGGLNAVDVDMGGTHTTMDLTGFDEIRFAPGIIPATVSYSIEASQNGTLLLALQNGTITVPGMPPEPPLKPTLKSLASFEILISSLDSNDIRRYDAATGKYLGDFAVGHGLHGPQDMLWGPNGYLYVSTAYSNSVLRFDGSTGMFVDAFVSERIGGVENAHGMAWGPDGNLYVSSFSTHEIKRYDGRTGTFIGTFVAAGSAGLKNPSGLRFGPDGSLYVSSRETNVVKRFDGSTGKFIDDFASANGLKHPETIEFAPDGYLYVCSCDSHEIMRFNGRTGAFVDTFIKPGQGQLDMPLCILFGPDGNMYVGDRSNQIKRFNGKTGEFLDVFCENSGMVTPMFMTYRRK